MIPASWDAALAAFEQSVFNRDYLGEDFQFALTETKRIEQDEFSAAVSPLEYDSYLVLA